VKFLENNGFDIVSVSLDPYFVRSGIRKAMSEIYFYGALMVQKVFTVNLYDTIWITARKRENR
jgi:hypothetical protein